MGIKILTVLLLILKILGITLLGILLALLLILVIVLFVPVRYQGRGCRTEGDTVPVHISLKATWLLHFVRVSFIYPEEAFLKVKILFFQMIPAKEKKSKKKETASEKEQSTGKEASENSETETCEKKEADREREETETKTETVDQERGCTIQNFIRKLILSLKNIKYTIRKIYDKIKHVIRNIRYYIRILQTESFRRAFVLCRGQVMKLLKSVLPGKLSATFTIGMEDPATTGQILSAYGILYPMIGDNITIIPDFEKKVVEGNFRFKGRITAFTLIRVAAKIYFDKDLKKVIRLFKKEAVQNGRK